MKFEAQKLPYLFVNTVGGLHEGILLRKLIKLYAYEAGPFPYLCFVPLISGGKSTKKNTEKK